MTSGGEREPERAATSSREEERDERRRARLEDARRRLAQAPRFRANVRRNHFEEDQLRVVLAAALSADSAAVDIGAHGGDIVRELRRIAPKGQHVAFEPLPDLATRLRELYPDLTVHQCALADRNDEATFVHVRSASPRSGLLRRDDYPPQVTDDDLVEITVPVRRLDDMLPDGYRPAVVKIDVEGAEELVLRGAERVLRTARPLVILEHSARGTEPYGTTTESLFGFLADLGMRVFDLAGDGPYSHGEFVESQQRRQWINYLVRW